MDGNYTSCINLSSDAHSSDNSPLCSATIPSDYQQPSIPSGVVRKNSVHARKAMEMLILPSLVSSPRDCRNPGAKLRPDHHILDQSRFPTNLSLCHPELWFVSPARFDTRSVLSFVSLVIWPWTAVRILPWVPVSPPTRKNGCSGLRRTLGGTSCPRILASRPEKSSAGCITNTSWNEPRREKDLTNNEDSAHLDPFSSGMADGVRACATSSDSGVGRAWWNAAQDATRSHSRRHSGTESLRYLPL